MSKRKYGVIEAEATDRSERNPSKRIKQVPGKAPAANGAVKHSTSSQEVDKAVRGREYIGHPESAQVMQKPKRRQERQHDKTRNINNPAKADEPMFRGKVLSREIEKKREGRRKRKKEKAERKQYERPRWKISDPIGGRMLNIDPLFSSDEAYLLLAYDTSIHVYSTSTSLLVRRLRTRNMQISGFAFSSVQDEHLYISTSSGMMEKWNWVEGERLEWWHLKVPINTIKAAPLERSERSKGLVYTVDRHTRNQWLLTAHRLMGGVEATKTDVATLCVYPRSMTSLNILDSGKMIVATAGQNVLIGITEKPDKPSLKDVTYTWREIECSEWITSIDVQTRNDDTTSQRPRDFEGFARRVDIVVGGLKGAIFIYEDILRKLLSKENHSKTTDSTKINPRKLHWHRNAVLAVKWSADGNYIISGGEETVLILWQLDTGQKQPLPHLTAAIESIVVSPNGSSYALRLADNSAMILSTSELQPTFSVSGIQTPSTRKSNTDAPIIPTIDVPQIAKEATPHYSSPATVTSSGASRLLVAVPTASTSSVTSRCACFLQTLDLASGQQIARQALTRTNITNLNVGPETNRIEEPSVKHIQMSHDGQWLATVDEWSPPCRDLGHLAFDDERTVVEQQHRLETYLKLWSWNQYSDSWELASRIDNPHPKSSGDACCIVGLASDPSCIGFATLGGDGMIRIWKPTARKRHGLDVRDTDGKILTTWSCRQIIELSAKAGNIGKLGYSADGSVLFAAFESSAPYTIYLVDVESGDIRSSPKNLFTGSLFGVGILERYLIVLSNDLFIWNMVSEELHSGFSIDKHDERTTTHLAINHEQKTFAIAIAEQHSPLQSQVAVFDLERKSPVFTTGLPRAVTSLLPAIGRIGFYCIDAVAEIRLLTTKQSLPTFISPPSDKPEVTATGLQNMYGNGEGVIDDRHQPALTFSDTSVKPENFQDRVTRVIKQEQLANVFEKGLSVALPPVADLFEKVAALFVGK